MYRDTQGACRCSPRGEHQGHRLIIVPDREVESVTMCATSPDPEQTYEAVPVAELQRQEEYGYAWLGR